MSGSKPLRWITHAVNDSNHQNAERLRLIDREIPAFDQNSRGEAQFRSGRAHSRLLGCQVELVQEAANEAVGGRLVVEGYGQPDVAKVAFGARGKPDFSHAGTLPP